MENLITIYSTIELTTTVTAKAAADLPIIQLAAIVNPPLTPNLALTRLEFILTSAVQTKLVLGLAGDPGAPTIPGTAVGSYVSNGKGGSSYQSAAGRLYRAWSANPTYPDSVRQGLILGVVGNRLVWEWPEGDPFTTQLFSGGAGIVVSNGGLATGDMIVNARWSEFNYFG